MHWLARPHCSRCKGKGDSHGRVCQCVAFEVYRICLRAYERYRDYPADWKRLEFIADFELTARRELPEHLYRLFRLRLIERAGYHVCCARLAISKGKYFHDLYRMEEILGRAFAGTRPYSLFPVYAYFDSAISL